MKSYEIIVKKDGQTIEELESQGVLLTTQNEYDEIAYQTFGNFDTEAIYDNSVVALRRTYEMYVQNGFSNKKIAMFLNGH
ncbi:hypothetical protein [Bacillus solimangrovi]|uniref:Uncharacterized protein n=1 Tax=Bacillus solimangrovi TaxID=1305675 RepID=A0A1E5LJ42_9BACI|nr:hypothetical protein [Bacillus solimangrovi]OEH94113.1 hypothetical protein BFG57_09710 [Bacillus solimangrovi]